MVLSPELRVMLSPRAAYARGEAVPASFIIYYVVLVSVLIAAAASVASTGRVTAGLLVSLALNWMFVPVLHILVATALVWSAGAARADKPHALALLLLGHAPWSLWILCAAAMIAAGGYDLYDVALWLALVPLALTARIVHAFCLEVLGTSPRGAIARTAAHQTITWLAAAIYLDRAVSLVPRIIQWLS